MDQEKRLPPGPVMEPITPAPEAFDAAGMARGEPGLPRRFTYRGCAYEVARVLTSRRILGPDRGGSAERYVRRHAWTVVLVSGERVELRGERGPRRSRWTLHRVE